MTVAILFWLFLRATAAQATLLSFSGFASVPAPIFDEQLDDRVLGRTGQADRDRMLHPVTEPNAMMRESDARCYPPSNMNDRAFTVSRQLCRAPDRRNSQSPLVRLSACRDRVLSRRPNAWNGSEISLATSTANSSGIAEAALPPARWPNNCGMTQRRCSAY